MSRKDASYRSQSWDLKSVDTFRLDLAPKSEKEVDLIQGIPLICLRND